MISEFVREQKRYTQADLARIFHCSAEKSVPMIRRLKEFGVLKTVRASEIQRDMSDLMDEDVEVADVDYDESKYYYVFTFVGVIMIGNRILKCCPKYLRTAENPLAEMKQVLRVITKYSRSEEQTVNQLSGDAGKRNFNLLAVILFLLNDYYEYGLYSKNETVTEVNGTGDIRWNRTIDRSIPVISGGKPYYMELFTRKTAADETDYFHRLHMAVLSECSRQLADAQLTELFDIEPAELTEDTVDDFGETNYILERLRSELSVQFNTRKQILLKTMYAYISRERRMERLDDCVSLFGTNSFNLVWEKACAEVFGDMLKVPLRNLKLPVPLQDDYRKMASARLIDIIERPLWAASDENGNTFSHRAKDTLIPDLVTISGTSFIIMDAKYYSIHMEKDVLRGQPGIESITKQYLYQLAYRDFMQKHGLSKVRNCFLFPTEEHQFVSRGHVEMEIMHGLGLENIAVRLVPADVLFDAYLHGERLETDVLKL